MTRLSVQITVDEQSVRTMQKTMHDQAIFDLIQEAVDMAVMRQMADPKPASAWVHVGQGILPSVRFFIGEDEHLYCSWNDACRAAGINNPYLEGSSLTKHDGPVMRGHVVKVVDCLLLINEVLNRRRVRREKVKELEAGIYVVLQTERDAGRVINPSKRMGD